MTTLSPARRARRATRALVALTGALVLTLSTALPASASRGYPDSIRLPNESVGGNVGFQPEGIDVRGDTAYAGSRADGTVVKADLRTGRVRVLVPADGDPALGVEATDRLLVVAGGVSGELRVYDRRSGAVVHIVDVPKAQFVNDVAVIGGTAYFTDSRRPVLYALPLYGKRKVRTIELRGGFVFNGAAGALNGNGIVALDERTVVLAQTQDADGTGSALYTVDVRSGVADRIRVTGGDVVNADGLVLSGRTLYVVQNQVNSIAQLRLGRGADSARIERLITDPRFDVPTTAALGPKHALYTVNARFGVTAPTDETRYDILRVPLRRW